VAQFNDLSRSLTAFDLISTLVVVVEMSKASWLVSGAVPGVERQPLKKLGPGCDGPVAIDRAVAPRGGACWPVDQANYTGLECFDDRTPALRWGTATPEGAHLHLPCAPSASSSASRSIRFCPDSSKSTG